MFLYCGEHFDIQRSPIISSRATLVAFFYQPLLIFYSLKRHFHHENIYPFLLNQNQEFHNFFNFISLLYPVNYDPILIILCNIFLKLLFLYYRISVFIFCSNQLHRSWITNRQARTQSSPHLQLSSQCHRLVIALVEC